MPEDNRFLQSLRLNVRPLHSLLTVLILTHGGAVLLVLHTALPGWLQTVLAGIAGLHGYIMLQKHILLADPRQPREVVLNARGQWLLTDGRGRTMSAELLADALIQPFMVALRFRTAYGIQRVLIVMNKDNADTLRRLRVRLRYPVA